MLLPATSYCIVHYHLPYYHTVTIHKQSTHSHKCIHDSYSHTHSHKHNSQLTNSQTEIVQCKVKHHFYWSITAITCTLW
ncbi:hypothetical protein GIB67_019654 [Kingdonia uniflora]|uniref:Uncharacterized protein n=1 Tax=Kingdonia uniflora TaxID=39325 RepID=A0A7J7P525_9MAGN|nr:hypothetical protein GIB67_019654 [Kingdonia uniflora]